MNFAYRMLILLVLLVCAPTTLWAKYVAVLETMADPAAGQMISLQERQYLTDVLRGQAVKQLPAEQNFTIMTRENINVMLPPGKSIEDCEGSCLAETGKNISADFVAQARIAVVGGSLAISAEIYETAGNKLLASFSGRGSDFNQLEAIINEQAPLFFKKVKGSGGGWGGATGFGDVETGGAFSFKGQKKFIVEIVTYPAGALPTIDGKGFQKCTSTPCKVQIEAGEHRFVASMDRYVDAEAVVDVQENNRQIVLNLTPNFGFLVLAPQLSVGAERKVRATVDGNLVDVGRLELDPGIHSVTLQHPCHDPIEFKVGIEKGKTETYDQMMTRGIGGLILDAEWNGEPQAVPVFIDGKEEGSTPFEGEVPMCATVTVGDAGHGEIVNADLKWHEVVKVSHSLKNAPAWGVVAMDDGVRKNANAAYNELDNSNDNFWGPSPTPAVPQKSEPNSGKLIRWLPIGISAAVAVAGAAIAVVGHNKAQTAHDKVPASYGEYTQNKDDIHSGQTLRTVGIVTAIIGAVGVGVSFAF